MTPKTPKEDTPTPYTTKLIENYEKKYKTQIILNKRYTAQMNIRLCLGCRTSLKNKQRAFSRLFHPVQCCIYSHLVAKSEALSLSHYPIT